jgi:UDP-N-acetylmuramoylalanine--D-glutamate ligase
MGIDREAVREGLRSFAGVPHRLEQVAEIGGVRFVNDSKATNVASATVGIRAFAGGVHAILGGSEKEEPFTPLIDPLRECVRACYLIGATTERMARELAPVLEAGVELHRCENLEDALKRAAGAAAPGEVILLSPACASFDAFENFERRGDRFREIVEGLR